MMRISRASRTERPGGVAAIDSEVCIRGQKNGIGEGLRHAHEAGIRQAHRSVRVFVHELQDRLQLVGQVETGSHGVTA
jgi:hypothetical protein